jgi:hypothetical protein
MPAVADMRTQAITGVIPPQVAEAMIASRWPGVAAYRGPAQLGAAIQQTAHRLFLATIKLPLPLAILLTVPVTVLCLFMALPAWFMLAPFFFLKVVPGFGKRYVVTNRRVMIQKDKGVRRLVPAQDVKLTEIGSVRVVPGSEMPFYNAADLEILDAHGQRLLLLTGVREYSTFLRCINDAWVAWARPMPKEQTLPASTLK